MCTRTSAVAVAATLFIGVTLPSQSSIRGWGPHSVFDTESRSGPSMFVSADHFNTVVIRADGRMFIQGNNSRDICESPPPPPGLHYVSAHVGEGCAIGRLSDGSLVVWTSMYSFWPPWTIPPLPAGTIYTKYALGVDHALLLRSDGVIVTLGTNNYGQRNLPTFPVGLSVVDVYAGTAYSGALLSDGSLWCWGSNGSGECNVPPLPPGLTYTTASLGKNQTLTNQTLALRSDGSMVAFGTYLAGINTVPPLPNGVTWVKCAAGGYHNVGLRSDGLVEVWGDNFYNQLDMPALPAGPIVDIDAGFLHTVVRLADGRVITWGGITMFNGDLPVLPGGIADQLAEAYVDVAVGSIHCIAARSDGAAVGFGNGLLGQFDIPPLPSGVTYVKFKATSTRSAALRSDGQLVMFGNCGSWCNVPPLPAGVTYVDAELSTVHTVALRSDGQAVAFGDNSSGISTIPPLPVGVKYTAVDAHYYRTLLLRSDDVLLSIGNFGNYPPPTVPTGVHFTQVAVSRNHDAALRSDGTAVLWGTMGTGFGNPPPLPWGVYHVEIEGGERWTALRRSDGQVVTGGLGASRWDAPPLDPGTSYVQLSGCYDVLAARVGPTSTYVGIGRGCSGSLGPARLVPADTPRIGKRFELRVFDLPVDLALIAMSFAVPPIPIPLAGLGMPGCTWHIGLDGTALLSGQNGVAELAMTIPDLATLVGLRFQHQALVLDPAAGNGFGAVVSDAMQGVIGLP